VSRGYFRKAGAVCPRPGRQRVCLNDRLGLNLILFFFGIWMDVPVFGFRPFLASRTLTSKLPKPERLIFPPLFKASFIPVRSEANAFWAWARVIPASLDIRVKMSFFPMEYLRIAGHLMKSYLQSGDCQAGFRFFPNLVDSPKIARYNADNMIGALTRKGRIKMKPRHLLAMAAAVWGLAAVAGPGILFAQDALKVERAVPKLIGQADLECSLLLLEAAPKLRISAPYSATEKTLLATGDSFYANPVPGVEAFLEDSLWTILEWGAPVKGGTPSAYLGNVVYLRGRARVLRIESGRAVMKIEKSCGMIQSGYFLVPYRGGEVLTGAEAEYNIPFRMEGAPTGRIVFLHTDYTQVASRGNWVVIDLGEAHGLKTGIQLTVYHREGNETPQAVANAVIVWAGSRWATVKILNSSDAVRLGDFVQTKPDF